MEDLLTIKQVSILLRVHHLTVRRYINEGKLKAIKLGGNVRVSQNELKIFAETYIPHTKSTKSTPVNISTEPFTDSDPLFRLKARGLSLDNLNRK